MPDRPLLLSQDGGPAPIIVAASDDNYLPLIKGLWRSVRESPMDLAPTANSGVDGVQPGTFSSALTCGFLPTHRAPLALDIAVGAAVNLGQPTRPSQLLSNAHAFLGRTRS